MLGPGRDTIDWPRPCAFFWMCFGYWCWFVDPENYLGCKYFGAAFMCMGIGILVSLHLFMYWMISRMCIEATTTGDMANIKEHWQIPHYREFFVAVTPSVQSIDLDLQASEIICQIRVVCAYGL